jgi:hypothetical protein
MVNAIPPSNGAQDSQSSSNGCMEQVMALVDETTALLFPEMRYASSMLVLYLSRNSKITNGWFLFNPETWACPAFECIFQTHASFPLQFPERPCRNFQTSRLTWLSRLFPRTIARDRIVPSQNLQSQRLRQHDDGYLVSVGAPSRHCPTIFRIYAHIEAGSLKKVNHK